MVAVVITFTVLAVACTCLRLYTRLSIAKSAGWDDAFITGATVCWLTLHGLRDEPQANIVQSFSLFW